MKDITYFELATGAITDTGSVKEGLEERGLREGFGWINGRHDASEERIDLDTLEAVPLREFEVPDEVTEQLTGIPEGTRATIRGEGHIIDDGEITLETSHGLEERVRVILQLPTYRPKIVWIVCPASE